MSIRVHVKRVGKRVHIKRVGKKVHIRVRRCVRVC